MLKGQKSRQVKKTVPKRTRKQRPRRRMTAGVGIQLDPTPIRNLPLTVRLTHRERIANLTATTANTPVSMIINPRRADVFPWLNTLATAFDMYRFNRLSFEYKPTCPTTTAGELVMAIDYDPTDDPAGISPANLASMRGAVSTHLYAPANCYFETAAVIQATHRYYCNSAGSADRLNDVGRFVLNARAMTDVLAGALYVSYDVTFYDAEPATNTYAVTTKMKSADPAVGISAANPLGEVANQALTTCQQAAEVVQQVNGFMHGDAYNTTATYFPARITPQLITAIKEHISASKFGGAVMQRTARLRRDEVIDRTFEPFTEDDDTQVAYYLDTDICKEIFVLMPLYVDVTPVAAAQPVYTVTTSENLTVDSCWNFWTGSYAAGVEVTNVKGSTWMRMSISTGSRAWFSISIDNAEISSTHVQNWTITCQPNMDSWVPIYNT